MNNIVKGVMKVAATIILIVAGKKTADSARKDFNNAKKSLETTNQSNN
ncbi:hypothetical protein [Alistipes sp.]